MLNFPEAYLEHVSKVIIMLLQISSIRDGNHDSVGIAKQRNEQLPKRSSVCLPLYQAGLSSKKSIRLNSKNLLFQDVINSSQTRWVAAPIALVPKMSRP